jgi:hypothetical protein
VTAAHYVYRNLRTRKWVIAERPKSAAAWPNVERVTLRDVTFKESAKAWARCLRNVGDKATKHGWEVHAYAFGEVIPAGDERAERIAAGGPKMRPVPISYDKLGCGRFVRKDNGQPITWCEFVQFTAAGAVAYGEVK